MKGLIHLLNIITRPRIFMYLVFMKNTYSKTMYTRNFTIVYIVIFKILYHYNI